MQNMPDNAILCPRKSHSGELLPSSDIKPNRNTSLCPSGKQREYCVRLWAGIRISEKDGAEHIHQQGSEGWRKCLIGGD